MLDLPCHCLRRSGSRSQEHCLTPECRSILLSSCPKPHCVLGVRTAFFCYFDLKQNCQVGTKCLPDSMLQGSSTALSSASLLATSSGKGSATAAACNRDCELKEESMKWLVRYPDKKRKTKHRTLESWSRHKVLRRTIGDFAALWGALFGRQTINFSSFCI